MPDSFSLTSLHRLLQRQLQRHLGAGLPELPANWQTLLQAVSLSYQQLDEDHRLLEHTLEQMSEEMTVINRSLRQQLAERLQAEQQLLASQARLAQVQQLAKLGGFEYELASGQLKLSDECRLLLGPLLDETESWLEMLRHVHPDDRICIQHSVQFALDYGEPFSLDCRVRQPDGDILYLHCQLEILVDEDEQPVRLFGTLHDVTDRKLIEAQLAHATRQLELSLATVEQVNQEMRQLAELSSQLQRCHDFPAACAVLQRFVLQLFPELSGVLYLELDGSQQYQQVAAWGELRLACAAQLDGGGCPALQQQACRLSPAAAACPHLQAADGIAPPHLCAPLCAQGEVLGVLHLQQSSVASIGLEAWQNLAASFAEQTALALSNLRLRARLHSQSIHDPLTGLFNRRHLENSLPLALANSRDQGLPLALAIIDIDHFKRLNDEFGHDAGDAALRTLARLLQERGRNQDSVYRLGGEEFVLLLPGCELAAAQQQCQQLLALVFGTAFVHQGLSLGTVTVSLGLAAYPLHGDSGETLLKAADVALYQAKQGGRNRVVLSQRGDPA